MTGPIVAAAVSGGAAAGQASGRPTTDAPAVTTPIPPQLQVPDGNKKIAVLDAQGVQTYACTNGAWTFVEPAATLSDSRDSRHRPIALHSRGPVWVSTVRGSAVNASAVPGGSVPSDNAVPQLLLQATATSSTRCATITNAMMGPWHRHRRTPQSPRTA
ncbi:DUF3455 domain-containing protein [Streptomyces sp. NPDC087263]|uniref:DUF3455 domain-containing protein n=1 Tax=Streptomyces sp. NPDC087263 TaxID=3365773 RepID=UPI0038124217